MSENRAREFRMKQVRWVTLVKQSTRSLRNKTCFDTDNKTRWTQHSTDTNLDGRIRDISDWKETMTRTLTDTDNEIEKVQNIEIISWPRHYR